MDGNEEYLGSELSRQPSIFISHSSKDVAVARAVRNLLEDRNHRFVDLIGLASLEGKNTVQQCHFFVDEIASRDWLVLIDSENAQKSPYVQFEIATARVLRKPFYTIDGKRFLTLGTRLDVESGLRPCVESLSRGLRIFMSYSVQDRSTAESVADWLEDRKYETFTDRLVGIGESWRNRIEDEIKEAAEQGVIIVLMSKNWLASKFTTREFELAWKMGGQVLPIALEPVNLPEPHSHIQFLDISRFESIEDAMPRIWQELNRIRHAMFQKHCGGIILNEWPGISYND